MSYAKVEQGSKSIDVVFGDGVHTMRVTTAIRLMKDLNMALSGMDDEKGNPYLCPICGQEFHGTCDRHTETVQAIHGLIRPVMRTGTCETCQGDVVMVNGEGICECGAMYRSTMLDDFTHIRVALFLFDSLMTAGVSPGTASAVGNLLIEKASKEAYLLGRREAVRELAKETDECLMKMREAVH